MELTYLTVFLEGRKIEKTQFDRDASNGLATFTVCVLYAAKSTSSLICKIQYKIHILEVKVQKLNVFEWFFFASQAQKVDLV